MHVKNAAAEPWFAASGQSLADVQNIINHTSKPVSFAFLERLRLTVKANIETTKATVNNVLGYLPGKSD